MFNYHPQDIFSSENWNILMGIVPLFRILGNTHEEIANQEKIETQYQEELKLLSVIRKPPKLKVNTYHCVGVAEKRNIINSLGKVQEVKEYRVHAEFPNENAKQVLYEIGQAIDLYHQINKTKLDNIYIRINHLKSIGLLIEKYKQQQGDLYHGNENECPDLNVMHQLRLKLVDLSGLGPIDNWIDKLEKRITKKINYLYQLHAHYEQFPQYKEKTKLLTAIKENYTCDEDELIKIHQGCLLEKLDPAHRQFEFTYEELNTGLQVKNLPMNIAFFEWVNSTDPHLPPFFLWLEAHQTTVTTEVLDENYRFIPLVDYKIKDLKKINIQKLINEECYQLASIETSFSKQISFDSQSVIQEVIKNKDNNLMFGVTKRLAVGFYHDKTMAFVWHKDKYFVTFPHKQSHYHHSSLVEGEDVRCSGMWIVKDGRVSAISNVSGHYKPSTLHFYKLIRYLYEYGLVNDSTMVQDLAAGDQEQNSLQEYLYKTENKLYAYLKKYNWMPITKFCFTRNQNYILHIFDHINSEAKINVEKNQITGKKSVNNNFLLQLAKTSKQLNLHATENRLKLAERLQHTSEYLQVLKNIRNAALISFPLTEEQKRLRIKIADLAAIYIHEQQKNLDIPSEWIDYWDEEISHINAESSYRKSLTPELKKRKSMISLQAELDEHIDHFWDEISQINCLQSLLGIFKSSPEHVRLNAAKKLKQSLIGKKTTFTSHEIKELKAHDKLNSLAQKIAQETGPIIARHQKMI